MAAGESPQAVRVRAQAEAAAWMALLHSPERNADIESGLRRWIAADPEHALVWEAATDLWNDTADLPRYVSLATFVRSRLPSWRVASYAACGVVCLIVAAIAMSYLGRTTVTTALGEQRTFSLDDGSRVELNTDSRLVVKFDRQSRTVSLESGEAYFQVAHERRPFVVVAGNRKVIAIGTEFTVRRDPSSSSSVTVTLIEGRVAVAPVDATNVLPTLPTPQLTLMNAGQRLKIRAHAQPVMDTPSIDKATGWTRGRLIFDHTPLREAAEEISRYTATKITVASREADISIGGSFRIGDTGNFVNAVAATHHLKVVTRADGHVFLEPQQETPRPEPGRANP